MLSNKPEASQLPEDKNSVNILDSLTHQLHEMLERSPERNDVKYQVLKKFVEELKTESFENLYKKLSPAHQHVIITRLENESDCMQMGGNVPYEFVKELREELYGLERYEDGYEINFEKKIELEKILQSEDDD